MRKSLTIGLFCLFVLAPGLWASKQAKTAEKLDKELRKITLTASDLDGRRVVNRLMAKQLGVGRKQLVEERRKTGFVYGQLFAAHEVARLAGLTFDEVAGEMREAQTLLGLCEERQLDMKRILKGARKLNKAIDSELERMAYGEEEPVEETAESYDPAYDSLAVDTVGFSPAEIARVSERIHRGVQPLGQTGPIGAEAGGGLGSGRGSTARPGAGGGRGRGPR